MLIHPTMTNKSLNFIRIMTVIAVSVLMLGMFSGGEIFAAEKDKLDQKKQSTSYDIEKFSKDPQFIKSLIAHMKKNHDFTQNVLKSMLDDPALRIQMIGHMTENQDAMKQINQIMKNPGESQKMKSMDHSSMKMTDKKKTDSSSK